MKVLLGVLLLCISSAAAAGGWTSFATPSQIDVERGNGFMIYGSFGNAAGCVVADKVYVKISHPQYKEIYSAALTAFTAGKKIKMHIASCEPVTWYSATATTYNILGAGGALMIAH
jgi:hypothetical protein